MKKDLVGMSIFFFLSFLTISLYRLPNNFLYRTYIKNVFYLFFSSPFNIIIGVAFLVTLIAPILMIIFVRKNRFDDLIRLAIIKFIALLLNVSLFYESIVTRISLISGLYLILVVINIFEIIILSTNNNR